MATTGRKPTDAKHQARPMVFVRTDEGCLICLTHKVNADGYLRKSWGNARSGDRVLEMFHRFVFRAHFGEVPPGCEVDHKCNVRACCEPSHLQSLTRAEHLDKTNRSRYRDRFEKAYKAWSEGGPGAKELADIYGVSVFTTYGWIRGWKLDGED